MNVTRNKLEKNPIIFFNCQQICVRQDMGQEPSLGYITLRRQW